MGDARSGDHDDIADRHTVPRWVRWFVIAAVVTVVIVAVLLLGGDHGPGRHELGAVSHVAAAWR